jgi:hypothetical protein
VVLEALQLDVPAPVENAPEGFGGSGQSAENPKPAEVNDPAAAQSQISAQLSEKAEQPALARQRVRKGTLSVNSIPWSNVFVDERLIGHTPRLAQPLTSGRHVVRLVAVGGEIRTRKVKILPGRETKLSVNFSEP